MNATFDTFRETRRNTKTIEEIGMVSREKGVWNNRENEKYGKIGKEYISNFGHNIYIYELYVVDYPLYGKISISSTPETK